MTVYYCGSDGRVRGLGDNELIHFNHNHDRLGRFSRSNGSSGGASKAQIKQAKRDAKLSKWKEKEAASAEKYYNKKIAKADKKSAKYAAKFKETGKARSLQKYSNARAQSHVYQGMKAAEKHYLKSANFNDRHREKVEIGKNWALSGGILAASLISPVTVVRIPSNRGVKQGIRLSGEGTKERIVTNATKSSVRDTEKLKRQRR